MPERTGRFAWTCKLARVGLAATLVLLTLALAGTVALVVVAATAPPFWLTMGAPPWVLMGILAIAIIGELAAGVWVFVLYGMVRAIVSNEFCVASAAARLGRIETLTEAQAQAVGRLADLAALSDRARSLIYREREIEAIRDAFHNDLIRQDYKTAETLINSIETKLGYADEAGRLRKELDASRKATLEEKIDAAVVRIQKLIDEQDWTRAVRESRRLIRLFPENPKVSSLAGRIEAARTKRKRSLLQAYGEAVRKNDLDQSIDLLKQLDRYLTPQEGAALKESARGVFRARLQQMGVQFAICVTDERWSEAIRAGEDIVREFPNSRMAQEVREKMDMLRARTTQNAEGDKGQ